MTRTAEYSGSEPRLVVPDLMAECADIKGEFNPDVRVDIYGLRHPGSMFVSDTDAQRSMEQATELGVRIGQSDVTQVGIELVYAENLPAVLSIFDFINNLPRTAEAVSSETSQSVPDVASSAQAVPTLLVILDMIQTTVRMVRGNEMGVTFFPIDIHARPDLHPDVLTLLQHIPSLPEERAAMVALNIRRTIEILHQVHAAVTSQPQPTAIAILQGLAHIGPTTEALEALGANVRSMSPPYNSAFTHISHEIQAGRIDPLDVKAWQQCNAAEDLVDLILRAKMRFMTFDEQEKLASDLLRIRGELEIHLWEGLANQLPQKVQGRFDRCMGSPREHLGELAKIIGLDRILR